MPRPLCSASSTASSAAGYAPSCASRKSAPAWDGAQPTINAGPMLSSRLTGYSPSAPPVSKRDIPDEETNDWRAVCGRTARTVRRAGRAQPFPTPIALHAEEHAGRVDRHDPMPGFGAVEILFGAARDAGIVDQNIERAKFPDSGGDDRGPALFFSDIKQFEAR